MTELRALSLWQPWASAIAVGAKTIETRSWATKYRGRLLIHAAKRWPLPKDTPGLGAVFAAWARLGGTRPEIGNAFPLGAVVASCVLADCVPIVDGQEEQDECGTWPPERRVVCSTAALRDIWNPWVIAVGGGEPKVDYHEGVFGDYEPGRYAWLLEDIKATTERCPRCWNYGWIEYANGEHDRCPQCEVPFGPKGCEPVSVRGHQGLWIPKDADWPVAA